MSDILAIGILTKNNDDTFELIDKYLFAPESINAKNWKLCANSVEHKLINYAGQEDLDYSLLFEGTSTSSKEELFPATSDSYMLVKDKKVYGVITAGFGSPGQDRLKSYESKDILILDMTDNYLAPLGSTWNNGIFE